LQNLSKLIKMRIFCKNISLIALFFCIQTTLCMAQQQGGQAEEPNYDEAIAKQIEDYVDRYKLDETQAFRIDTLLQHFIPIYNADMKRVKAAGAAQMSSYQMVMDKWGDFFDNEYQKIFTEEQWKLYMKSSAGKEKKKRDKRLAAARGEMPEGK